ncbi:MAG TPA: formate dehydrogenase accessory sulfurtransferase FdhD [Syntrophorhabdaceae bacterium]|nr:formate dehydrogenase accessory sulfurtransferase FdhD [Syntrophorhabdaceae bacterium]
MRKNRMEVPVVGLIEGIRSETEDLLVVEEPMEIFLNGSPYYLTMRMPGEEMPLALGYCFTEGTIDSIDDVALVNYCQEEKGNRVEITLDEARMATRGPTIKQKRLTTYSSCGICGKDMIEDIHVALKKREKTVTIDTDSMELLRKTVEDHQEVSRLTGATHAAALFNRHLKLLSFSEDVGRHNALDKAIGNLVFVKKVQEAAIVFLTSRLSYEMVQKAARLGAEILIGMSSATLLAAELAQSIDLTLVKFSGRGRFKIYSAPDRIIM